MNFSQESFLVVVIFVLKAGDDGGRGVEAVPSVCPALPGNLAPSTVTGVARNHISQSHI